MSEMEARRYIAELFKIVGNNSVLVVTPVGKVKRLHCPFWVICKVDVPPLQKGGEYTVESVKMTLQKQDVFILFLVNTPTLGSVPLSPCALAFLIPRCSAAG